MRSRWNWIGAGIGVLLASASFFMRHSGSAATDIDLSAFLHAGDQKIVLAQNDNGLKPPQTRVVKPKAPPRPSAPAPEAQGPSPAPAGPQAASGTSQPAPAPEAGPNPLGELQPVLHAQGAKITTCMDMLSRTYVLDSAALAAPKLPPGHGGGNF